MLPVLLRLHLQFPESVKKEKVISHLLSLKAKIPQIITEGSFEGIVYSIQEWIEGISLRDLLLSEKASKQKEVIFEVGSMLAKIQSYTFSSQDFFDETLIVRPMPFQTNHEFVLECLDKLDGLLDSNLSKSIISSVSLFDANLVILKESVLVHGDFDPSNIFVKETERGFKIAGILD